MRLNLKYGFQLIKYLKAMSDDLDKIGERISRAVSEVEMEKAGIEGLDEAIGGLPSKSVILLVGEPGCNNTTFAQDSSPTQEF